MAKSLDAAGEREHGLALRVTGRAGSQRRSGRDEGFLFG